MLEDYDTIIFNLLSLDKKEQVNWERFTLMINSEAIKSVLGPGGNIIVIGDPRFNIKWKLPGDKFDREMQFLYWTCITFNWDRDSGDTLTISDERQHGQYRNYVAKIDKWDYSLRSCKLDDYALNNVVKMPQGISADVEKDEICWNRYNHSVAFTVRIVFSERRQQLDGFKISNVAVRVREWGKILFLPSIDLSQDEILIMLLRDICGIETNLPEPEWINEYLAPGQRVIDDKINQIKHELSSLNGDLSNAEVERNTKRACLKLLYDRGLSLEEVVRNIFRSLGADVDDPKDPGKEDGWITVDVGDQKYEGVLEVKSTRNEQFGEDGIRQLLDWINRGVELRQKKYKGIFIGSNDLDHAPGERPNAYSANWKKSAELHQVAGIKTEELYALYVLKCAGKLNTEYFWTWLFATNGIFDISQFLTAEGQGKKKDSSD